MEANLVLGLITAFFGILLIYFLKNKSEKQPEVPTEEPKAKEKNPPKVKNPVVPPKQEKPVKTQEVVSPDLFARLKALQRVTSVVWDPTNKYIICTGEDTSQRTISLFSVETLNQQDHKQYRIMIQGDYPVCSAMSHDGKILVVGTKEGKGLLAYGILPETKKNKDGKVFQLLREFDKTKHGDLCSVELTSDSKYILVCSKETTVTMWDTKGKDCGHLQTKQLAYSMAHLSPKASSLAIATAMSDIKLFSLSWSGGAKEENERGSFIGFENTSFLQLSGHTSGITSLAFLSENELVSCSKDGTWKFWNWEGDFKRGFHPKVVFSINNPQGKEHGFLFLQISPNKKLVATASRKDVCIWNLSDGQLIQTISDPGFVSSLSWSPNGQQIVVASTADTFIRIYNIRQ